MKTFKVHECGNSPEEALYRALCNDDKDTGIRKIESYKECMISPLEVDMYIASMDPSKEALYLNLGQGEYMFFGKVE